MVTTITQYIAENVLSLSWNIESLKLLVHRHFATCLRLSSADQMILQFIYPIGPYLSKQKGLNRISGS